MTKTQPKTIQVKVERTLEATPAEAYKAWLDPKCPGTVWHEHDKLLLNPEVDGFFYWNYSGNPHYGRFTKLERGSRIEHTWMSTSTSGLESTVTISFTKQGSGTLMTLVHSGLPDTDGGRGHEKGWNFFMGGFEDGFRK